jgi:hypothetical protein
MGYIEKSDLKKIYGYLTQTGKEKILTGDTVDFEVKYFSLHDEDINYLIASKTSGLTFNIPKSGFIPDITGDINNCLPNISDATYLEKNRLLGGEVVTPPPSSVLTADVVGTCSTDGTQFQITVSNPRGGAGGYKWFVKTDILSFPTEASTIDEAIVISSSTSIDYNPNIQKSFRATFKFSDTYLPRSADTYNYTVYLTDSLGSQVEIKKFKDINCSLRKYGWVVLGDIVSTYVSPNLITEQNITELVTTDYPPSLEKYSVGIFVIDNGNRRKDLNISDTDIPELNNSTYSVYFEYVFSQQCAPLTVDTTGTGNIAMSIRPFDPRTVNVNPRGIYSETIITDGQYTIPADNPPFGSQWFDTLGGSGNIIPSSVQNSPTYQPYTGMFDLLHPTVLSTGPFKIAYLELIGRGDFTGLIPSTPLQFVNRSSRYKPMTQQINNEFKYSPREAGVSPTFNTDQVTFTFSTFICQ